MQSAVLVLNSSGAPINMYNSYRPAINKLENKRAEVIATYPDRVLRSWKQVMEAPAIIRLLYFAKTSQKRGSIMKVSRRNVWVRDKGHCQYCNKFVALDDMHWDHVIPKEQGGVSLYDNLVTCCQPCNRKKRNRTPEESGMRLLSVPVAPKYTLSVEKDMMLRLKSLKNLPDESWRKFVYYDAELEP